MSPRSAAHALGLLRPRIAVPIHWGTLYLPGSAYNGKQATYAWFQRTRRRPEEFAQLAGDTAPDVDVRLLEPGESLTVEHPAQPSPEPAEQHQASPSPEPAEQHQASPSPEPADQD